MHRNKLAVSMKDEPKSRKTYLTAFQPANTNDSASHSGRVLGFRNPDSLNLKFWLREALPIVCMLAI